MPFQRVLVVMFENQYRNYVLQSPFMRKLASAGADMGNYFGAFHPSQTNYVASLAGEVCAVTNDTPPASPLLQRNLVDLLEEANISWKAYMEAYPNEAWNPAWAEATYPASQQPINEYPDQGDALARYFRKHNAFASFHTIQKDEARWAKIVDEVQFWKDLGKQDLPQYSWFTPDIWNDGHYLYNTHTDTNPRTQLIPQVATWLEYTFFGNLDSSKVSGGVQTGLDNIGLNLDIDLLISDPETAWQNSNVPEGTLIVVTFDEADFNAQGYDTNYDGQNQIYTVLLGDMIQPGTMIPTPYNHYSLIKTIQRNFSLKDLGKNDVQANWFRFLWQQEYKWSCPAPLHAEPSVIDMAAVLIADQYVLLTRHADNSVQEIRYQKGQWASPTATGINSIGPMAAAQSEGIIYLAYTGVDGYFQVATSSEEGIWFAPQKLAINSSGAVTMASYTDLADQKEKLMLCYLGADSFIQSLIFSDSQWQSTPTPVGQITDGPMALAQMGPSLYLVYKEWKRSQLRLTSFNLAPFNSFDAQTFDGDPAPDNNTSLHQWSPADIAVGHFAQKFNALQADFRSRGDFAMASIEGEMHLAYRQEYDNAANAAFFGLTGIFTASSALTNGWGTIRQAGWTTPSTLDGVAPGSESPMTMAQHQGSHGDMGRCNLRRLTISSGWIPKGALNCPIPHLPFRL